MNQRFYHQLNHIEIIPPLFKKNSGIYFFKEGVFIRIYQFRKEEGSTV